MNMMKNANNTTKTKLLTLLCKELRDSNESIAITNHYLLSSQSPALLLCFLGHSLALLAASGAAVHSIMGNGGCVKAPDDFSKKENQARGREQELETQDDDESAPGKGGNESS